MLNKDMKYKITLFVFVIISFQSMAQHNFSVGLSFSPEVSNEKIDNLNTHAALAQTSGLIATYDITKRFGLTSGLWYSSKSYYNNTSSIDRNGIVHKNVKHFSTINYLEVPLLLNIKAGDSSKVGFYSSVGPVFGIPVGATWKDKPDVGYNQSVYGDYINTVVSAYLGIGASVKFSEKCLLIIEPNVKRTLTKLYSSESYEAFKYFYSFGLRFGLTYKL